MNHYSIDFDRDQIFIIRIVKRKAKARKVKRKKVTKIYHKMQQQRIKEGFCWSARKDMKTAFRLWKKETTWWEQTLKDCKMTSISKEKCRWLYKKIWIIYSQIWDSVTFFLFLNFSFYLPIMYTYLCVSFLCTLLVFFVYFLII